MKFRQRVMRLIATLGLTLLCAPLPSFATMLAVSLDTSQLVGNPAAPFYIEFQLNDGSGTNDGNNTAAVTSFDFGGGAPGDPSTIVTNGGAGGCLNCGVTITDNSFFNQFYQQFTPGTTLTFEVNLTENVDSGPQPDEFTFAILDCSQTEIPTTSPANALLTVDISAPAKIQTFSGTTNASLACNGQPGIPLPAPATAVLPEPGTLPVGIVGLAFVSIGLRLTRRRRASRMQHKEMSAGQRFSP